MAFVHAPDLPDARRAVSSAHAGSILWAGADRTIRCRSGQDERDPFRSERAASTGRAIGYLRVSTTAQRDDRQVAGLAALCDELRLERVSAVADRRPVFETLLADLTPGDTLVVWDLDRAFRSTIDALLTMEGLNARGIALRIVTLQLDTATAEGELFYTFIAGFAQYERRMIARRTREGMAAARRRGVHLGRPRALDEATVHEAHRAIAEDGYPCRYVAALLGVSRITLQRALRRLGLSNPPSPTPTKRRSL